MDPLINIQPSPKKQDGKHKRNKTQRALDMLLIERWQIQGKTLQKIVDLLAEQRPYTLSRTQIAVDLKKLRMQWQKEAMAEIGHAKTEMLRSMRRQEDELWEAWEKSKQDITKQIMTKSSNGVAMDEKGNPTAAAVSERKSAVKETGSGEAAYMRLILEIHDRRSKLLGLDAPIKSELSAPGGGPLEVHTTDTTGMSPKEKDELLARHYERIQRNRQSLTGQ